MAEHEDIKVNNTKAHLASLKGELTVVAKNLSDTLEAKTEAENKLASLNTQILEVQDGLSKLYTLRDETNAALEAREKNVTQREDALNDERAGFEKYRTNELQSLSDKRDSLDEAIKGKEELLTTLTNKLEALLPVIKDKESILVALTSQVADAQAKLDEINKQVAAATEESTRREDESQKRIDAKKKELAEVEAQIVQKLKEVETPQKQLDARIKAQDARENDFAILLARQKDPSFAQLRKKKK